MGEAGSTEDKVDKSTKKAISFGISLSKKKTPQIKLDSAVSQAAAVASKNARVTLTESQKQVTVKPQHTLAVTSTEAEAMSLQSNAEYKDRASQRRGMWGPSVDIAQDIGPTAREESRNEGNIMKARTVHAAAEVRPEENLGDDSVGNKMLKKLGWSKGENLGRGGDAGESGKFLKQDWEKIENLAAESAFPKPYGRAI